VWYDKNTMSLKNFLFFIFIPNFAFALTERKLDHSIATTICNQASSIQERDLWKLQIYDSGVQIQLLNALSEKQLRSAAKKIARKVNHLSYSTFTCEKGEKLILTYPSPVAFQSKDLLTTLPSYCESTEVRFANAKGKKSIPFAASETLPRQSGIVTVTCFPKDSALGSVLWFTIPTGNGPLPKTPIPLNRDLPQWINSTRISEGLKPLQPIQNLDATALLQNEDVSHLRAQMELVRVKAEKVGIKLVAEDRVIAKDLQEAAWLLWNSPRHRDSLLDANISKATVFQKQIQNSDQILFIVLTAK